MLQVKNGLLKKGDASRITASVEIMLTKYNTGHTKWDLKCNDVRELKYNGVLRQIARLKVESLIYH